MAITIDDAGNKIGFRSDGLYLKLAKEERLKQIFKIKNGVVSKWVSPHNILRKANAIGFNYDGLKRLLDKEHKEISVQIGSNPIIVLKIQDILDKKEFLWFKAQGFERQIFWKLEEQYVGYNIGE